MKKLILLVVLLVGCSKTEAPPAPAAQAEEKPKISNNNPYADHMRELEKAKNMGAELDKQARERVEAAEGN
jgi:PBP1b-binding outer membrane lipoprotein LpoB